MPGPTPLTIATSSLARLVKEEASYHAEYRQQEEAIRGLESARAGARAQGQAHAEDGERDDGVENEEFLLKQWRKALEETNAIFPRLREKIERTVGDLEGLLASTDGGEFEVARAREAINGAKKAMG